MSEVNLTQCCFFPELFSKPLVVSFDQLHASSDGGAILLRAADRRLGLTSRLGACLVDERQDGKIEHTLWELIGQRVYGIACGYTDANDAARLADDPIFKLLLDRQPVTGQALASQPTLSRFENGVAGKQLFALGETIVDSVLEKHQKRLRKKAKRITLDLDPTADPTHGAQQLSFFHGYYDTSCYLPLLAFASFNDEAEQYLLTSLLRPGNAPDKLGAVAVLKRLIAKTTDRFPLARILVRLDGGFACPEVMNFLSSDCTVDYVAALPANSVLNKKAKPLMRQARKLSQKSGKTEHVYGQCWYQAQTWSEPKRVIIKAEVVRQPGREPKDNARFVATNCRQSPRHIYQQIYCQRGEIENRVKELHDLGIGRTSCSKFWANQFRLLLTTAAYVLMQELRAKAARTACARAQVQTIRERLLKIGVWICVSVRRLVIHMPAGFPYLKTWTRLAQALGASPG